MVTNLSLIENSTAFPSNNSIAIFFVIFNSLLKYLILAAIILSSFKYLPL